MISKKKIPFKLPELPETKVPLTAAMTARGTEYYYQYEIRRNDREDENIALSYSAMQMGHGPTIEKFGKNLSDAIIESKSLGRSIEISVVHPGRSITPNAAYLLSHCLSQNLKLSLNNTEIHHISLESSLAARPLLKNALGTGRHSSRWNASVTSNEQTLANDLLKYCTVLFIDDCVLSGTIIDKYVNYLKSINNNPENVIVATAVKLIGGLDLEFETYVDTCILRSPSEKPVLLQLLKDPNIYLTTRLVYHLLKVDKGNWDSIALELPHPTLFSLYLFAVSYFGNYPPDRLDNLVQTLGNYGISLPNIKELKKVKYESFFRSIDQMIKNYQKDKFKEVDSSAFVNQLWSW